MVQQIDASAVNTTYPYLRGIVAHIDQYNEMIRLITQYPNLNTTHMSQAMLGMLRSARKVAEIRSRDDVNTISDEEQHYLGNLLAAIDYAINDLEGATTAVPF